MWRICYKQKLWKPFGPIIQTMISFLLWLLPKTNLHLWKSKCQLERFRRKTPIRLIFKMILFKYRYYISNLFWISKLSTCKLKYNDIYLMIFFFRFSQKMTNSRTCTIWKKLTNQWNCCLKVEIHQNYFPLEKFKWMKWNDLWCHLIPKL